jgi:hypothetical protein
MYYCSLTNFRLELELELFLRPTVSLGIGPPFVTLDQMLACTSFFLFDNYVILFSMRNNVLLVTMEMKSTSRCIAICRLLLCGMFPHDKVCFTPMLSYIFQVQRYPSLLRFFYTFHGFYRTFMPIIKFSE